MKILVPPKTMCWGDLIASVWAIEYIKTHLKDSTIIFNDRSKEGRIRDSVKLPWVDDFGTNSNHDYEVCTHHNLSPVNYSQKSRKIFFDTHGLYFRFIEENWYPTLNPTSAILRNFERLDLPKKYSVVHHSWCCEKKRNQRSEFEDFVDDHKWITDENLISTGTPFPKTTNLQHLCAWTKQLVLVNAEKVYVSHSGFTGITAMYRKRKNTFLIDYNENANLCPPPIACYTNVTIQNSHVRSILYALENSDSGDYYQECRRRAGRPLIGTGPLVPEFDLPKPAPEDYRAGILLERENCPVFSGYKQIYTNPSSP
jgi:hypothetical protein